MRTLESIIPGVLIKAAVANNALLAANERSPDAESFLERSPERLDFLTESERKTVETHLSAALDGKWSETGANDGSSVRAYRFYHEHKTDHAYVGTVFLSMMDTVFHAHGVSAWKKLRSRLRKERAAHPFAWELARHFGRPSVPLKILPVFAIHEAEKKLGHPLPDLSKEQRERLGI